MSNMLASFELVTKVIFSERDRAEAISSEKSDCLAFHGEGYGKRRDGKCENAVRRC